MFVSLVRIIQKKLEGQKLRGLGSLADIKPEKVAILIFTANVMEYEPAGHR